MHIEVVDAASLIVEERLDLYLIKTYGQSENLRLSRQKIVQQWRENPLLVKMALSSVLPEIAVTEVEDERAIVNLADYFIEKYYLTTMSAYQADAYLMAIEDRMNVVWQGKDIQGDQPLLIESMHHHCIFSIFYLVSRYFIGQYQYNKIIMLYQQEEIDPRLTVLANLGAELSNVTVITQRFDEHWFRNIRKHTDQQTIVLYLGDMPPSLFNEYQDELTSTKIFLERAADSALTLEGFSVASKITRLLKAEHLLLDFPNDETARLRLREEQTELHCALESWIFWPSIPSLYQETPHLTRTSTCEAATA